MSATETTAAPTTTEAPKARKVAKAKPKAAKKPVKPSANGKPRARKEGLRLPQVRILKVLTTAKGPMTRAKITDKVSQGDKPTATGYSLGSTDASLLKRYAKECGYPSLLLLGFARQVELDIDGKKETSYEITAAGRKALEKAK